MNARHYIALAEIIGGALAAAYRLQSESSRTAIYNALYRPLALYLKADNPAFDELRFAAAVAQAEFNAIRQ